MDPNQQPQNQNTQSTPPVQPDQPTAPLQTSPAVPSTDQALGNPPMPSQLPPSKSKTGLIIGLIIGAIVIMSGLFFAFLVISNLQSSSKAQKASDSFLSALTSGDQTALAEFASDETEKKFLDSLSNDAQGEFSLREKESQNDKHYFLYDLTHPINKEARTIVEQIDGKWEVTSIVVAEGNLALIPSSTPDTPSESASPPPTPQNVCLVQTDFDTWYQDLYDLKASEQGLKYHEKNTSYKSPIKFGPDSFEYIDQYQIGVVETMVDLANSQSIKGKQWKIRLAGSVATGPEDAEFANNRSKKVKEDLVQLGISEDRIVIDEPKSVGDYYGEDDTNATQDALTRNVIMEFDPSCEPDSTGNGR